MTYLTTFLARTARLLQHFLSGRWAIRQKRASSVRKGSLALALGLSFTQACFAAFPERQVTLIVPYPAGGVTDVFARAIAAKLSETWGQTVIVDNKAGGGTLIGTQFVSRAQPDGYTLLLTSYAFTSNPILRKELPYDVNALTPLSMLGTSSNMLVINAGLPYQSLADVLTFSKQNPGALTLASSGNGSSPHIAAELFASETGVQITHVPYKGTAPAMNDVLGGQIIGIFDGPSAMSNVRTGKLRAIAIASRERHPSAPEVPTFNELGIQLVFGSWFGFFMPAGAPDTLQQQLFDALQQAIYDPKVQTTIAKTGLVLQKYSQQDFQQFLKDEAARLKKLTQSRSSQIKIE